MLPTKGGNRKEGEGKGAVVIENKKGDNVSPIHVGDTSECLDPNYIL